MVISNALSKELRPYRWHRNCQKCVKLSYLTNLWILFHYISLYYRGICLYLWLEFMFLAHSCRELPYDISCLFVVNNLMCLKFQCHFNFFCSDRANSCCLYPLNIFRDLWCLLLDLLKDLKAGTFNVNAKIMEPWFLFFFCMCFSLSCKRVEKGD